MDDWAILVEILIGSRLGDLMRLGKFVVCSSSKDWVRSGVCTGTDWKRSEVCVGTDWEGCEFWIGESHEVGQTRSLFLQERLGEEWCLHWYRLEKV